MVDTKLLEKLDLIIIGQVEEIKREISKIEATFEMIGGEIEN